MGVEIEVLLCRWSYVSGGTIVTVVNALISQRYLDLYKVRRVLDGHMNFTSGICGVNEPDKIPMFGKLNIHVSMSRNIHS